ncbi:hypothetical protein KP509_36G000600 [Ceratopteris richardii]|uniref:Uncharacterized protein n=1 Tax=Ceratopteris richardii TaxID=49495 RepID=A0A8T2QAH0_CERRI|nr:hypothetical protein KP509_36G000600 [Ceratopteris richardii]
MQLDHDIRKGLIILAIPIETCLAHVNLIMPKKTLSLIALIDSGASSCFIDEGLVTKHGIPVLWKNKPLVSKVVDGGQLAVVKELKESQDKEAYVGSRSEEKAQADIVVKEDLASRPFKFFRHQRVGHTRRRSK